MMKFTVAFMLMCSFILVQCYVPAESDELEDIIDANGKFLHWIMKIADVTTDDGLLNNAKIGR